MDKNNKSSLVAERTLNALLLFTKKKSYTVNEVATELSISLSAAYRIMEALTLTKFIMRQENREYILNPVNLIGLYNMIEQDLRKIAKPYIYELSRRFKNSVYMSIMHADNLSYSYIEREDSQESLKWSEKLGYEYKLPTGSAGKTHLAYYLDGLSEEQAQQVLQKIELPSYTKNSITDKQQLVHSLQEIVKRGYCFTNGEHIQGAIGISVPIYNYTKTAVQAVISVFIPEIFYDAEKLNFYVEHLKQAASIITESKL